jgi:hypothetical protein
MISILLVVLWRSSAMAKSSVIVSPAFSEISSVGCEPSTGLVTRQVIGDVSSDSDGAIASEDTLSWSEQHLSSPGSQDDPESYGIYGRIHAFPYSIIQCSAQAIPLGNGGIGDGTSSISLPLKSCSLTFDTDHAVVLPAFDLPSEFHSNSVQTSGSSSSSSSDVFIARSGSPVESQAISMIPAISEKNYSRKRRKACCCVCT